jgi:hypothetical protein
MAPKNLRQVNVAAKTTISNIRPVLLIVPLMVITPSLVFAADWLNIFFPNMGFDDFVRSIVIKFKISVSWYKNYTKSNNARPIATTD